jgi:SAM-dependent methyltransferase
VVDQWLEALRAYNGQSVKGTSVLELGPGADFGPALFLLERGASRYLTVDAHRLIDQTPADFYETLLGQLQHADELAGELKQTLAGSGDRIRFDLSILKGESIQLVFSQAAFEHFDDVNRTISQLSDLLQPGAVLIAEVDLMTHTGVLRSRDPLNIYRFPGWLYRWMYFSGIPNRLRPEDYRQIFAKHGWQRVEIEPLQQLSPAKTERIRRHLARPYRSESAQMHVLSQRILATR